MTVDRPVQGPDAGHVEVRLTRDEASLVVTALRVLRATLGREEADELAEVERVLVKLAEARAAGDEQPG